jgi:hypothetical protein
MTTGDRMDKFRSRFGLSVDTDGEAERFRIRLLNAWDGLFDTSTHYWLERVDREFATINGSRFRKPGDFGLGVKEDIHEWLSRSLSFSELIRVLQNVLYAIDAVGSSGSSNIRGRFASAVDRAIDLSRGVDLRLDSSADTLELMPAGVEILDAETVDPAVEWLGAYPDVQKEFRTALRMLADKSRDQYRQAQDALRFGLEKLLKILLANNTRIEEQTKPLKEWLALRGVNDDLGAAAVTIMNRVFCHYQNAAVKHDNQAANGAEKTWSDFEIEYVIYQFAALVRLLMEASKSTTG